MNLSIRLSKAWSVLNKTRWTGRLQTAHQMGMLPGRPLTVWFGTHAAIPLTRRTAQNVRRAIEHAIIRTLIKSGVVARGTLRNRRSFREFDVVADIQISRLLPSPYAEEVERRRKSNASGPLPEYQGNVLRIPQGTRNWELPAQEWGQELGL